MLKANYPNIGPECMTEYPSLGVFRRNLIRYLSEFEKKNTKNSEWLGQKTRPGFEPGISRLPALSAQPIGR